MPGRRSVDDIVTPFSFYYDVIALALATGEEGEEEEEENEHFLVM